MSRRRRTDTRARRSGDQVPLSERQRWTQVLRLAMAAVATAMVWLVPEVVSGRTTGEVLPFTLAYLIVAAVAQLLWYLSERLRVRLFGALLILDGVWLAWLTQVTGASLSPLRYLVLLHLIGCTLLGSYRTGLKLALWHSLLLLGVQSAVDAGQLTSDPALEDLPGSETARLAAFGATFWIVAIGTATASAINERELRRRRHDVEALAQLGVRLEDADDSGEVAERLLHEVAEAFDVPRGVVVGAPDGSLSLLAGHGEIGDASGVRRAGRSAVVRAAHEDRHTRLVSGLDPESDPWLDALLPDARRLGIVPLTAEGRPLGALVLELPGRSAWLERRVVDTLERFGAHGALALRNAWLLETVQRMAATDGLTKIANRRTFETTLEREASRASRSGEPLSLVLVDIDHFKDLNDTHGHQAGDEVLRNVAAALACECRDFDTAARYGGEEFAVVLPRCSAPEALAIAERLRRVAALAPNTVPVTVSAGVATLPDHAHGPNELVRAADEALYESKKGGRNRVTLAGPVTAARAARTELERASDDQLRAVVSA